MISHHNFEILIPSRICLSSAMYILSQQSSLRIAIFHKVYRGFLSPGNPFKDIVICYSSKPGNLKKDFKFIFISIAVQHISVLEVSQKQKIRHQSTQTSIHFRTIQSRGTQLYLSPFNSEKNGQNSMTNVLYNNNSTVFNTRLRMKK